MKNNDNRKNKIANEKPEQEKKASSAENNAGKKVNKERSKSDTDLHIKNKVTGAESDPPEH